MADQIDGIDFAVAAYREEGVWQVQEVADTVLTDIETLAHALRRLPGDGGAVGMIAIDEDFFVLVRVTGPQTRVLLSDVTAADEWELARSAVEHLRLPFPEEEDEQVPAGDLDIVGDLGMHAMDMGVLLDDVDLYPDEMLSAIARRLGFGPQFDDAVGLTSALRRFPGDGGALGMVAYDEDVFLLLRVAGARSRVLLSDITAAEEWELAASAVSFLGLPDPVDEDEQVPAGDLDLLGDLGLHAMDLAVMLDDVDLYPDEILSDVARRLGFGDLFDDLVGLTSA